MGTIAKKDEELRQGSSDDSNRNIQESRMPLGGPAHFERMRALLAGQQEQYGQQIVERTTREKVAEALMKQQGLK